jgi:hypothetical protein
MAEPESASRPLIALILAPTAQNLSKRNLLYSMTLRSQLIEHLKLRQKFAFPIDLQAKIP